MIRRPPRSTRVRSSAASDVYKRQLPHPVASQRGVRADRHTLTQLELGDGLASLGHDRLLAGDRGQVAHSAVDELRVTRSLADTHVDCLLYTSDAADDLTR